METKTITVKAWPGKPPMPHCRPHKLIAYIAFLQTVLAAIPEELRESACVNIVANEGWYEYEIEYERPETQQERENRERDERRRDEHAKHDELQTLKRLLKKYPDVKPPA